MPSDSPSREVALDERQLDALREVANIGCGHAANALSSLIGGQRVAIDVPRASFVELGAVADLVGGAEEPVVGVATDISGGLSGQVLLLMSHTAGHRLAGLLLGQAEVATGSIAAEARSALCEVGNILGSACLSAIARAFGMRLVPSIPRYSADVAAAVVDEVISPMGARADRALVLETRFFAGEGAALSGHFLIMPDLPSLPALMRAMGL